MAQISARIPDKLVKSLDAAARDLKRARADIVRQAIEHYLDDYEDIARAIERLRDPTDPVLDWENVKRDLLGKD